MEIWKSVVGYEGFYEVSSHGRIRTVSRRVENGLKNSGYRTVPPRVLKQKQKKNGYKEVSLCRDGVVKTCLVHRVVASAFLERKEGETAVNHKNLHKDDNRVENLEWCTYSYNSKHAADNGVLVSSIRKEIRCVETGDTFPSSYQAAEWVNRTRFKFSKNTAGMSRHIRACATGKQLIAYGFHWIDV